MKRLLSFTIIGFVLLLAGCKDKQEPRETEELDTCIAQIIEEDHIEGCMNARGTFSEYVQQYFLRFEEDVMIDTTTATFDSESNILYYYVIFYAPDTDFSESYRTLETMYQNILEDLHNATDTTIWLGLQFNHGNAEHRMIFNHKDDIDIEDTILLYISTLSEIEDVYVPYLEWLEEVSSSASYNKVDFQVSGFDHTFEMIVYPDDETYQLYTTKLQTNTRLSETNLQASLINRLPESYEQTE